MFRMRSWSSAFSSTALKWKGIKFKIAFPSVLWHRFWMRSSASLRCQASATQQTTLICAAASSWWPPPRACLSWRKEWSPTPGCKIESATRLSLALANCFHFLNLYFWSQYIFNFINKFQEGSQCLNSTALGVAVSSSFDSRFLLQQSSRRGSCEYISQCKSEVNQWQFTAPFKGSNNKISKN